DDAVAGAEMTEAAAEGDVGIERNPPVAPRAGERAAVLGLGKGVLPDGNRRVARIARPRPDITRQDPHHGLELGGGQRALHGSSSDRAPCGPQTRRTGASTSTPAAPMAAPARRSGKRGATHVPERPVPRRAPRCDGATGGLISRGTDDIPPHPPHPHRPRPATGW